MVFPCLNHGFFSLLLKYYAEKQDMTVFSQALYLIKMKNSPFALGLLILFGSSLHSLAQQQPIDRFELVNRHNVVIKEVDALAPVSVGNGDFAFTAYVTGMQSL